MLWPVVDMGRQTVPVCVMYARVTQYQTLTAEPKHNDSQSTFSSISQTCKYDCLSYSWPDTLLTPVAGLAVKGWPYWPSSLFGQATCGQCCPESSPSSGQCLYSGHGLSWPFGLITRCSSETLCQSHCACVSGQWKCPANITVLVSVVSGSVQPISLCLCQWLWWKTGLGGADGFDLVSDELVMHAVAWSGGQVHVVLLWVHDGQWVGCVLSVLVHPVHSSI